MNNITLIWADGSITTAETYKSLEAQVRAAQWRTYTNRHEFRKAMRRRATVWSGAPCRLGFTHRQFIESLAEAGLFIITTSEAMDSNTNEGDN